MIRKQIPHKTEITVRGIVVTVVGVLVLNLPVFLLSQNLFPDKSPVYKDDLVSRVDILIDADSLSLILAPGNEESDHHFPGTFIFDNGDVRDTVESIGFRLRGNTSRYSSKKSYKVSFNTFEKGRKWNDLEKLNLNGEHNDPSVMRSKLCWDLLRDFGVPAPRASHVSLYINNEYFGLYVNVEHIDEEFVRTRFGNNNGNLYKCLWPADLNYMGENPDLYKFQHGSRRAYELITNSEEDNYADLAHFIDVLNNTPIEERHCELEAVFNVNSFLRAMAFDILSGNWDGPLYNKNNFYLYKNEKTGQFEYIPYDLDNTFGIDWFNINWAERNIYSWAHPNEPRPLFSSIMEVQEYRDKFSFYVNEFLKKIYTEEKLFQSLETLKSLIRPSVENDPFYPLSYGYTLEDFDNSMEQPISSIHTPIGIKTFISKRINSCIEQLQINNISPIISKVHHIYPNETGHIIITAEVLDENMPVVEVCYKWNNVDDIICEKMYDNGEYHDENAGDHIYTIDISTEENSGIFQYFVKSIDILDELNSSPKCGFHKLEISNSSSTLAINELMASNNSTIADGYGEYDDWIEVTNYGDQEIFLGGRYLSDKKDNPIKWSLPDLWIQPGEYLLFWADEDGEQGDNHTNFKLNASGEFIGIYDTDENGNQLIDGIHFGPQSTDHAYGRLPDGTGPFQMINPSPGAPNGSASTLGENNKRKTIVLYPNPFIHKINIELEVGSEKDFELIIYNQLGQVQDSWQVTNASSINTTGLRPGVYIAVIKADDSIYLTQKMVKVE